jgi:hypothetical protein
MKGMEAPHAMQYLLLLYHQEAQWQALSEEQRRQISQEYFTFTRQIQESGHYLGGNPLQPTSTAATVRVRDQKPAITDGPFAETKEQLGGYYLVEAKDAAEAASLAARIPAARYGSVEVRPILSMARP